jgi:hypothetical protein
MRLDQGETRKYSFFGRIDRTGLQATSLQRTPMRNGFKGDALESPTAWSRRFVLWVSLLEQRLNHRPLRRHQIARIGKLAIHHSPPGGRGLGVQLT